MPYLCGFRRFANAYKKIVCKECEFDGKGEGEFSIVFEQVNSLMLEGCTFKDFGHTVISISGVVETKIEKCVFKNCIMQNKERDECLISWDHCEGNRMELIDSEFLFCTGGARYSFGLQTAPCILDNSSDGEIKVSHCRFNHCKVKTWLDRSWHMNNNSALFPRNVEDDSNIITDSVPFRGTAW